MIDFHHYQSILCLNGTLPALSFFKTHPLPIIAADGAANRLMEMGLIPEIVIGDLDSIEPSLLHQLKTHYHHDQNYCDFDKSLLYLKEQALLPAIIVGVNGGLLDHVLNNINIFMHTDCVLYAPPIIGYVLRENETKVFDLPIDTKLSFIGMPSAVVYSLGLKWELRAYELAFPGQNSCFNRTLLPKPELKIEKGSVLALIYLDKII